MSSTRIPLIYGGAMFGAPGTDGRVHTPEDAQKFIDVLLKHGQIGIDTSRNYTSGTSEQIIAQLDLGAVRVDTKVHPVKPGGHAPSILKAKVQESLTVLGPKIKIRVLYLHVPDRSVPYEETLEALDELYRQGHFEKLGLSNYMSWEVAEIVGICERRGFVKPTVYQGVYNLLDRGVEPELFPGLRKFGIKFTAYSTLAGGFLTGKHLTTESTEASKVEHYSHFDPKWPYSHFFIGRYSSAAAHVQALQAVANKHDLKLAEVSIRWLMHHSPLAVEDWWGGV